MNANFNQQKIQEADKGTVRVATEYDKLTENYKQIFGKIEALSKLITEMPANGGAGEGGSTGDPAIVAERTLAAREILGNVRYFKAKPIEELVSRKQMDRLREIPVEQIKREEP